MLSTDGEYWLGDGVGKTAPAFEPPEMDRLGSRNSRGSFDECPLSDTRFLFSTRSAKIGSYQKN